MSRIFRRLRALRPSEGARVLHDEPSEESILARAAPHRSPRTLMAISNAEVQANDSEILTDGFSPTVADWHAQLRRKFDSEPERFGAESAKVQYLVERIAGTAVGYLSDAKETGFWKLNTAANIAKLLSRILPQCPQCSVIFHDFRANITGHSDCNTDLHFKNRSLLLGLLEESALTCVFCSIICHGYKTLNNSLNALDPDNTLYFYERDSGLECLAHFNVDQEFSDTRIFFFAPQGKKVHASGNVERTLKLNFTQIFHACGIDSPPYRRFLATRGPSKL
jgi:hypothetical protein